MSRPVEQVRKLLLLVPAAWKAGPSGLPLDRAARACGARGPAEVEEIVSSLGSFDLAPSMPDDALQLDIENGRVVVGNVLRFLEPLPFSLREGAALVAALRPFEKDGGRAVASAIRKLRRAVPEPVRETADALARATDFPVGPPGPFAERLQAAIDARLETVIEYRAEVSGTSAPRTLEPRVLLHHGGHWYLAAWNVEKGEEHLFRLDRISDVRAGSRVFGEHRGPPLQRYRKRHLYFDSGAEREVKVRFTGAAADVALEQWPARAARNSDGSVVLTARVTPGNFLLGWVLGYGGDAVVESPADARDAMRSRVDELLALYADPGPG